MTPEIRAQRYIAEDYIREQDAGLTCDEYGITQGELKGILRRYELIKAQKERHNKEQLLTVLQVALNAEMARPVRNLEEIHDKTLTLGWAWREWRPRDDYPQVLKDANDYVRKEYRNQ